MKFAHPLWLIGSATSLVVALLLVLGGLALVRSIVRFGDRTLVEALVTYPSSIRRAAKGVLVVLATALVFVAMARPQYGRGTRLIPATNLDVVIVLDYSKSMYARDIAPSRIARAKAEVARLVRDLPGARFAAVAFAGEPIGFPLTSDGMAIAQFFRQLEPNDMPVGGTAVARALQRASHLLVRDPKSKDHRRVIVLITDGEDLEGDPVSVARSIGQSGTTINVVQIGGRTPERIPDVDTAGNVTGWRTDDDGKLLMTSLSATGEAQLVDIAQAAGGNVVRAGAGSTGIEVMTRQLEQMMHSELAEKVETVFADVFYYPLGAALALLLVDTFLSQAKRRKFKAPPPPPARSKRLLGKSRKPVRRAAASAVLPLLWAWLAVGCGWTPAKPFDRNAPEVDQAIVALDAGEAGSAASLLEAYVGTGECSNGSIGVPDKATERHNATFDLGLALFHLAEQYGARFGEEPSALDGGTTPEQQAQARMRSDQVDCAVRLLDAIAAAQSTPVDLAARARYLQGNLEFLRGQYRAAVQAYDEALTLIPGVPEDAGDGIGRDAAWNRAIALRRIEEENERDAAADSSDDQDGAQDAPQDQDAGAQDGSQDGAQEAGDEGHEDAPPPDAGSDGPSDSGQGDQDGAADGSSDGASPDPQSTQPEAGAPDGEAQPPQTASQDDRILDMLESAPTVQLQDAKNRAARRRARGMADK